MGHVCSVRHHQPHLAQHLNSTHHYGPSRTGPFSATPSRKSRHQPRSCLMTLGEKNCHFGSRMFDSVSHQTIQPMESKRVQWRLQGHMGRKQSKQWRTLGCFPFKSFQTSTLICVQCSHVASASPSAWCGIPFHTEALASAIAKQKDDSIAGIAWSDLSTQDSHADAQAFKKTSGGESLLHVENDG